VPAHIGRVVFTTVPAEELADEAILALYRLRWQVELHIKRDKSLGGLDRLPNFRPDTIEGWVSATSFAVPRCFCQTMVGHDSTRRRKCRGEVAPIHVALRCQVSSTGRQPVFATLSCMTRV
jgi:hypothetical protein